MEGNYNCQDVHPRDIMKKLEKSKREMLESSVYSLQVATSDLFGCIRMFV